MCVLNESYLFSIPSDFAEYKPKQAHSAAQILWTVLCSGRW